MKKRETARRMAFVGVGAGFVLFALVGFLPGSLLGGVMGLNIAGGLFGFPVHSALLPRLIVGLSMLAGIFVSAAIFIAGSTSAGWLVGCAIDSLKMEPALEAEVQAIRHRK